MTIATAIIGILLLSTVSIFIIYVLNHQDPKNFLDIENDTISKKQNYKEIKNFAIYTTKNNNKFIAHKCRFDIGDKVNKDLPLTLEDVYIDFI